MRTWDRSEHEDPTYSLTLRPRPAMARRALTRHTASWIPVIPRMISGEDQISVMGRRRELEWRRSRRCESGSCVEVAMTEDGVLMRDSKDAAGPVLQFDREEWAAFLGAIRQGDIK
ncbi:DUF397 domain-containing protein [Rugosimonospora acidiphila]|uniref:DUF397 domain-containing protein n=1 Tax=Rugosimonospora acidiphila TaxID=556531 RepID=UPI003CD08710